MDGQRNGKGELKFTTGRVYVGDFKNGYRHGRGIESTPSGYSYSGDWRNNLIEGSGVMTAPDGTRLVRRDWPVSRLADLVRDARWVVRAREAAVQTLRSDPRLEGDPELRRAVHARWGDRLELAGIG